MSFTYQKISPIYLFRKYKKGIKRISETDIQKLNLRGKIKKYQIIKEDVLQTEMTFNEFGYLISKYENNDTKVYNYISETNLLTNISTYFGQETVFDNLISEEYFKHNKNFSRHILKETKNYKFSKHDYIDKYSYDVRGNLIAIITYKESIKNGGIIKIVIKNYDLKNNEIGEKIYFPDKVKHIMKINKIGTNSIKKIDKYVFDPNKGYELITNMTEIIDENNLMILRESYTIITGDLKEKFIYDFDKNGNWISKTGENKMEIHKRNITSRKIKTMANIEYW